MGIGFKLQQLLDARGKKAGTLASETGVSRNTIYAIIKRDNKKVDMATLDAIAANLGVSIDYFFDDESPALPTMPANIVPIKRHTVPLLGEIAAGQPIYADEEHDLCVAVDDDIRCDFALRVRGDSMIDAGIYDGDVVLVRQQDDVDDGQIAVVLIDDEATLKYLYHQPGGVQLVPANRRYSPWSYTGEAAAQVRILGLAVAQYHKLV